MVIGIMLTHILWRFLCLAEWILINYDVLATETKQISFKHSKVKSVEHALSWSLDSKQLPLPLPLARIPVTCLKKCHSWIYQ